MKKDVPKEFLEKYEARRDGFKSALDQIITLLKRKLSDLAASTGVRARITDARVKRPAKIWGNAKRNKLTIDDAFAKVIDIIGIRIVCNNLSDIPLIAAMIRSKFSILDVGEVVNMVLKNGYRATHIRAFTCFPDDDKEKIPCEIQIRTLAQDTWGRLSREDIYGKKVPQSISILAHALSSQLSAIDEIAQLIRDELNQCPVLPEEIKDADHITPPRLAFLYRSKFDEKIHDELLIEWRKYLEEAEAKTIGDVRDLLEEKKTRDKINRMSNRIRGCDLADSEWAVYSALVASELSRIHGLRAVRSRIKTEWDEIMASEWEEIVAIARREALSEMPDTIEEFAEMLKDGEVPFDALAELGGITECFRCGTDILQPEQSAGAVMDYYEHPDTELDLELLFFELGIPEIESADYSGACQYCGHKMSKDE